MTPDLLRRAGEVLYGPLWQRRFAEDFNINPRTLRRWLAGVDDLPEPLLREIHDALSKRVREAQLLMPGLCSMEHAK